MSVEDRHCNQWETEEEERTIDMAFSLEKGIKISKHEQSIKN